MLKIFLVALKHFNDALYSQASTKQAVHYDHVLFTWTSMDMCPWSLYMLSQLHGLGQRWRQHMCTPPPAHNWLAWGIAVLCLLLSLVLPSSTFWPWPGLHNMPRPSQEKVESLPPPYPPPTDPNCPRAGEPVRLARPHHQASRYQPPDTKLRTLTDAQLSSAAVQCQGQARRCRHGHVVLAGRCYAALWPQLAAVAGLEVVGQVCTAASTRH